MYTILMILHLLACLLLIAVVLMQSGKGGLGSAFGESETFFGGRGAAPFLARATTFMAVLFMLTSVSLAFVSGKQMASKSAIERAMQQGQRRGQGPAPVQPEQPRDQVPAPPQGK